MSSNNTKILTVLMATAVGAASSAVQAQESHEPDRYGPAYEESGTIYDYAKVVDVYPLTTRVRVSTPQRECWDETRYEGGGYETGPNGARVAGGTLLGAAIGAVLGHQIGSGRGRDAATAGGAVIGAAIGHQQAKRRHGVPAAPREYTVQRCETRYRDEWQERVDGYRVTYLYQGQRQVTQLPYNPGERLRVRVDVSPAE